MENTKGENYELLNNMNKNKIRFKMWASLAELGGLGLRSRPRSEEKSSWEVWWSERPPGGAGPLTFPLASSAESGFVKERAKQF